MKLYGSKRSLPRSFPGEPQSRVGAAPSAGSAMTGRRTPVSSTDASSPGFTVGTVGTGPVAWDEVFAPASAPGVLAPDPTGHVINLYSKQPCCCG